MRQAILASVLAVAFIRGGCSRPPQPKPEVSNASIDKPPSLAKPNLFPAPYRDAIPDVAAFLSKEGNPADQFCATAEQSGKLLVFHLWHESAFLPENLNVTGNPGGKCRDVHYDPQTRSVVKTLWWQ